MSNQQQPLQKVQQMVESMPEAVYQRLADAVATGRWPDGAKLAPEQRDHSLQLVMAWQARHLPHAQHMQINQQGEIAHYSKAQLKAQFQDQELIPVKSEAS